MIFIVDSNILISGLIKEGLTRQFLVDSPFKLCAPETLISEIRKHEDLIIKKSGLSKEDFEILLDLLIGEVDIIFKKEYWSKMGEADRVIGHIDKSDIPFVALALSIPNDGIWSDDMHFKKQNNVKVFNTSEIIDLTEKIDKDES